MGQSSCISMLTADTHAERKDGESYVNEFRSLNPTPLMSPTSPFITTIKKFVIRDSIIQVPPDPKYAKLQTQHTEMENDMPEAMKAAIASMEPFLIVPDPNLQFSTNVYLIIENNYAYCGQWLNGKPYGFGVAYHLRDKYFYEGVSDNGAPNGLGRKILADGSMLQGTFTYGELTGDGTFKSAKGHVYTGQFVNSRPHGKGQEVWQDGSEFTGTYINGLKENGRFTWRTVSDYANFEPIPESYTGQFKQNLFHGHGTYEWGDGRGYVGEWAYGSMNGQGVYTWPDGRRYEGGFENDLRHGHGTMSWNDQRQWKGEWKNGKMDGFGVYIKNGSQCEGEWKNGERVRWITKLEKSQFSALSQTIDDSNPEIRKARNLDMQSSLSKFADLQTKGTHSGKKSG